MSRHRHGGITAGADLVETDEDNLEESTRPALSNGSAAPARQRHEQALRGCALLLWPKTLGRIVVRVVPGVGGTRVPPPVSEWCPDHGTRGTALGAQIGTDGP